MSSPVRSAGPSCSTGTLDHFFKGAFLMGTLLSSGNESSGNERFGTEATQQGVLSYPLSGWILGMIFWCALLGGGGVAVGMEECQTQPPCPKDQPLEGWKVDYAKEEDRLKIVPLKEGVVLEISSPRGIGRATVERTAGPWPKKVVLRLYLKGLESLRVEVGQWGFEASVMSYPPYQTRLRVHGPDPMPPVDPKSPYWVEVRMLDSEGKPASKIPLEGGYFELAIPHAFLEKAPQKLLIHWIDFYRE